MLDNSNELTQSSEQDSEQYKILSQKHDRSWTDEWNISEYAKNTDALIGKITHPSKQATVYRKTDQVLDEEKRDLQPPNSVIYLDKSARPVEWLVRSLWDVLAREPGTRFTDGKVPPRPKDYFLNIDKEEWLRRIGVPEKDVQDAPDELVDISKIPAEHISRIRALFSAQKLDEENISDAWEHPTVLDGQHVMIVDEVRSSGQTLKVAQKLLSIAIPEATFSGQYWAEPPRVILNRGVPDKDGKLQFKMGWIPAWYSQEVSLGRGISDKDPSWPERAQPRKNSNKNALTTLIERAGDTASRFSKIGRHILSTPTHNPDTYELISDPRSDDLRSDINLLARQLREGKVFFRPSSDRPSLGDRQQDFVDRTEAINMMSFEEWKKKRDAVAPKAR